MIYIYIEKAKDDDAEDAEKYKNWMSHIIFFLFVFVHKSQFQSPLFQSLIFIFHCQHIHFRFLTVNPIDSKLFVTNHVDQIFTSVLQDNVTWSCSNKLKENHVCCKFKIPKLNGEFCTALIINWQVYTWNLLFILYILFYSKRVIVVVEDRILFLII